MRTFKGALIGCGFFSRNHLHAWRDLADVQIVALCDADETRLRTAAQEFGIKRLYTDAAEMLCAEDLDFVDIATTVSSHRALVELAASAKVAAICQKPFARTLDDARAMVETCSDAGVALMVHENFRWQSAIQAVGAALHSGKIGEPFWGRVSFRSGFDVFSGQPYLATQERFIVEDLGIHVLDVARYLFGNVKRLYASTSRVNPSIKGEDVSTMMLHHEQGMNSIVDCSYTTRLPRELFPQTLIEVDGSAGTLRLLADYRLQIHSDKGTEIREAAPSRLAWMSAQWEAIQSSVLNIQSHWIDCLRVGLEPATSGRDNLETLALVEATYVSARERRSVDMAEYAREAQ